MTLTDTSVETGRYIGSRMLRKEDAPLIAGQGRYVDNLVLPGMLFMAVVRSPMAHARITGVDVSAALQVPGVVAAYSGADLASDWAAGLPCAWPVAPETRIPTHWPVAQDKARMVGDPVAVVVADTREHAVDGAEAVDVDYDPLPPVTSIEQALADGAPVIHDEFGDNVCFKDLKIASGDVDKARSRTSCGPCWRSGSTSPSRSSGSSPPTSAAPSAPSWTSTARRRSAWPWRAGSACRSSGSRSAPRATWPPSTAAT